MEGDDEDCITLMHVQWHDDRHHHHRTRRRIGNEHGDDPLPSSICSSYTDGGDDDDDRVQLTCSSSFCPLNIPPVASNPVTYPSRLSPQCCLVTPVTVTIMITVWMVMCSLVSTEMSDSERIRLRDESKEMFQHGFSSYMKHAFPADELMPLSCKGRYRDGIDGNRGDLDDALGNFSLTLIDSLDSLVIFNQLDDFEQGVRYIVDRVTFDSDIVVSVFEVNIRIVGGLISAHLMAIELKSHDPSFMFWYQKQLLTMAIDVGNRLLPAFDTITGIPHPRVNLKHGMNSTKIQTIKETCSACAGTIILEFAALSRLTDDPKYEEVARKSMDYLWFKRNRSSDLIGTIMNINSGTWIRKDSGVGAGVDSYYEYLFKAYIMLGDDLYLKRFNKHYASIRKYISQGPLLVDVHMHRPTANAKGTMDSLLAFWPGLQVLKGDLIPAIETHELLYQVMQKNNYLMPEAYSISDFGVHWAMSLIRPEFIESTYFLFKSTRDPHYLEVGKRVMQAINRFSRTECGFAAVKDVRTGSLEDRMDSFVLAETFKYLYLLFANEDTDVVIDLKKYIFTTEAHLLPLSLATMSCDVPIKLEELVDDDLPVIITDDGLIPIIPDGHGADGDGDLPLKVMETCPSASFSVRNVSHRGFKTFEDIRASLKGFVSTSSDPRRIRSAGSCSPSHVHHVRNKVPQLRAEDFSASNPLHLQQLNRMGIHTMILSDGKIQLMQSPSTAQTEEDAEDGTFFMQQMMSLSRQEMLRVLEKSPAVQYLAPKIDIATKLPACAALFGPKSFDQVAGQVVLLDPFDACTHEFEDIFEVKDRIAILQRGGCMFVQKARHLQARGAIGMIVVDNQADTTIMGSSPFRMSGDEIDDVSIPALFLFGQEGKTLTDHYKLHQGLRVTLTSGSEGDVSMSKEEKVKETSKSKEKKEKEKDSMVIDDSLEQDDLNKLEAKLDQQIKRMENLNVFLDEAIDYIKGNGDENPTVESKIQSLFSRMESFSSIFPGVDEAIKQARTFFKSPSQLTPTETSTRPIGFSVNPRSGIDFFIKFVSSRAS